MELILKRYENGEINRKETYKLLDEKLGLNGKIEKIYEKYFKPSQQACVESINNSCSTFTNYIEFEEETFSKFVYDMVKNEERIREVKELATTV